MNWTVQGCILTEEQTQNPRKWAIYTEGTYSQVRLRRAQCPNWFHKHLSVLALNFMKTAVYYAKLYNTESLVSLSPVKTYLDA